MKNKNEKKIITKCNKKKEKYKINLQFLYRNYTTKWVNLYLSELSQHTYSQQRAHSLITITLMCLFRGHLDIIDKNGKKKKIQKIKYEKLINKIISNW